MSWTASSRTFSSLLSGTLLTGCAALGGSDSEFPGAMRDFRNWEVEAEQPGTRTSLRHGVMDIDSPAGVTVWLTHRIPGPVEIQFDATAVSAGGPNDQVSDLNVFWMATNVDGGAPFTQPRTGRFESYNDLLTYYVGLGGNRNTTTRFRRYIGDPQLRPLLPEHDLSGPDVLLMPNKVQRITLIADGEHIEYRRDGKTLFSYRDPYPYKSGWFAFRTTKSHLRIERLRIHSLR